MQAGIGPTEIGKCYNLWIEERHLKQPVAFEKKEDIILIVGKGMKIIKK